MKPLKYWVPAIGFALVIFILSSIPGSWFSGVEVPLDQKFIPFSMQENPDKFVHGFLYATFGWLWLRALVFGIGIPLPKAAWIAMGITVFYGATDEWHQFFVPDRYCDLNDWIADCVGGAVTILPLSLLYPALIKNAFKMAPRTTSPAK